jgi:coenzyme F420 hydrogenase subunit beta
VNPTEPTPPAGVSSQWRELYHEVVTTGLCTGCAACVMACPRDVLDYDHETTYQPFNVDFATPTDDCTHGRRGCDICTRACPRFRAWEPESDVTLFGRARTAQEVAGISRGVWLVRATDPEVLAVAQDGGLVSALLLWGLATDRIEGALTSRLSTKRLWDAEPFLATTPEEVLEAAGSRYTYAAAPLAMKEAEARRLRRLALVGMGCQASINGTVRARGVNKYARRIELVIGLLCSKSFDYEGMREVLADHGVPLEDVAKVNIKGRFTVWRRSTGEQVDIPLKTMRAVARQGCTFCPDFAAEHADISVGGLGQQGWSMAVVRTERGQDWLQGVLDAGAVEVRPADEDPAALALLDKLSVASRRRWPAELPDGAGAPRLLPLAPTT